MQLTIKVNEWYTHKIWGDFTVRSIRKVGGVVTFFIETINGGTFTETVDSMRAEKRRITEAR